jgi:hypothetical protein
MGRHVRLSRTAAPRAELRRGPAQHGFSETREDRIARAQALCQRFADEEIDWRVIAAKCGVSVAGGMTLEFRRGDRAEDVTACVARRAS